VAFCPDGRIAARLREQQADAEREAPQGAEWVRNEAGEPDLVKADAGLEQSDLSDDELRDWQAAENAAYDQRLAAARERSIFLGAPWPSQAHRRAPAARRTPRRESRTTRPRARRSPRATRAGPQQTSDDPPDDDIARSPAAVLTTVSRAHGITCFTRAHLHAVRFLEVVVRAINERGELGYG
jgi:hypothetical protein